jgi:pyridoxamine 5'-phosphate oxidase
MTQPFEKELAQKGPLYVFQQWYEEAVKSEINDPDAMCLATATPDGKPSARMVLFKSVDERGFKFHTNATSQKGVEIESNKHVALCIHWKSLRKQVRVEGIVSEIPPDEANAYFKSRPRKRQIGAWASDQSSEVKSREAFEARIKEFEDKFKDQDIPRPPQWKGYIIQPEKIEFWFDNPDRLHDRFIVIRGKDGKWEKPVRLYP